MSPAFHQSSSDRRPARLGRRGTAFLLALAIDILIVLALLKLAPALPDRKKADDRPTIFQTLPEPKPTPAPRTRVVAKKKRPSGGAPRPAPPAPQPPAGPETPPSWLVSKDEFASSDLSKLPSRSGSVASADGAGSGKDSGSAYGPGEGPGGQTLYNAEWYREPTDAEMGTYLPKNIDSGWGLIACQTIPGNRVENCRSLGETPGSGISRAMRLASWQFLVRPPRINGRPVIGAWVRIRFDLRIGITK
jgi:protein TonB